MKSDLSWNSLTEMQQVNVDIESNSLVDFCLQWRSEDMQKYCRSWVLGINESES